MTGEEARPAAMPGGAAQATELNPAAQDMDAYIQQRMEEVDVQAEEFQEKNPAFDMRQEIQNPTFCKYVWGNGLTVEEAYYLTHREELTGQAEESAARKSAANARRIDENGAGKNRPAMTKKNPRDMSDEEIDDIIARVRRGEKVKF